MAGKKLLVADDSLTIQKVIRLALSSEGYDIQAVSDGNDAIQQISLFKPDIVLIDVALPGKNAFEVKRAINQQGDFKELKFILMCSAFEPVDEAQTQEVEFHGRLTKPFDPAHLRQVLTDVLAHPEVTSTQQIQSASPPSPPADEDDFMEPIKPNETLVVAPPRGEPVFNLWEKELPSAVLEEPDPFAQLSPPPLPGTKTPDLETEQAESDVRHLTESTIRMSGLDDFQWTISDPVTKKSAHPMTAEHNNEPSLPPLPGMADLGGSNFQLNLDEAEDTRIPPFPPNQAAHALGASAYFNAPDEPESTAKAPQLQQSENLTISPEQLEQLITRQIQDTLSKMAKEILPQVAERVIKQEINRLLQEQP